MALPEVFNTTLCFIRDQLRLTFLWGHYEMVIWNPHFLWGHLRPRKFWNSIIWATVYFKMENGLRWLFHATLGIIRGSPEVLMFQIVLLVLHKVFHTLGCIGVYSSHLGLYRSLFNPSPALSEFIQATLGFKSYILTYGLINYEVFVHLGLQYEKFILLQNNRTTENQFNIWLNYF